MRFLIPETVQTSAVDCGPAALKSLLDGFGIESSYGRLRELCQTALDGTSIDTIENVAREAGLDAEQIMVPVDNLELDDRILPAVVVTTLPNGFAHFVVVWRRVGEWFQIMDPAVGRIWMTRREFIPTVYRHRQKVDASAWREWAGSAESLEILHARIAIVAGKEAARDLIADACTDARWTTLGRLDASTRMASSLIRAGAIRRGSQARRFLSGDSDIPDAFHSVSSAASADEVMLRGAVLLTVREQPKQPRNRTVRTSFGGLLSEKNASPARRLLSLLHPDSRRLLPPLVIGTAALGTTGVVHGLVFRALFDLVESVGLWQMRVMALGLILGVAAALLFLEYVTGDAAASLGRELQARLSIAFFEKVAALRNDYFNSRLVSDMAERVHSIQELRYAPFTAYRFVRAGSAFVVTIIAICFLQPASVLPLAVIASTMLAVIWMFRSFFFENDLRVRTHAGGLGRFYLEALGGLTTLHAHTAERSVRREHESLLTEWLRASRRLIAVSVSVDTLLALLGLVGAATLIRMHLSSGSDPAGILLIAFWALTLPLAAANLSSALQVWSFQRSIALRVIEPLDAPEERSSTALVAVGSRGVALDFDNVAVKLAGHDVLREVSFSMDAGTHVAVVGRSGAGKSTIVSALLGLIEPSSGEIRVDGERLDAAATATLRAQVAWVDPAVQLWNAPLEANIIYGSRDITPFPQVIREADLFEILGRLTNLQRPLGEDGGLLSGGEGQRVRVARALMMRSARLVILDEAFRGVDRETRADLLRRSRDLWRESTLICITHDIDEALSFDRVLVVENGCIVEDGPPHALLQAPDSSLSMMRAAATRVHEEVWGRADWRRVTIDAGQLHEQKTGRVLEAARR